EGGEGGVDGEVEVGWATGEGGDLVAVVRADADWDELLRAVGALASNRQPVPPQGGHLRRDAVCLPHLAPVPPAARFGSVVWIGVDVLWRAKHQHRIGLHDLLPRPDQPRIPRIVSNSLGRFESA